MSSPEPEITYPLSTNKADPVNNKLYDIYNEIANKNDSVQDFQVYHDCGAYYMSIVACGVTISAVHEDKYKAIELLAKKARDLVLLNRELSDVFSTHFTIALREAAKEKGYNIAVKLHI